jgi:nucleoid DNA-binding protein
MKLFENKIRTDKKPAKHNDNEFDFFDRSDSDEARVVRGVLNAWFDNYPKNEKSEFKKRFGKEFSSSLYELFIHELFIKQGFTLEPHPKLENSSEKPDFLAKGNGLEFYIEVKESTDKTDAERAIDNMTNQIYDLVNQTNSPNFFLHIEELNFKKGNQPSSKKVVRYLESKLPEYNPDLVLANIDALGINATPIIRFEDESLFMMIKLMPKPAHARGIEDIRPIGIYPSRGFIGGAGASIKSALSKKATRYGELDKPFLICINSKSIRGTDNYDVMNALLGNVNISSLTNPSNGSELIEGEMNGFFRDSIGPKYTKVSAVMINRFILGHIKDGKYWFVKHPFAQYELDFEKFEINKIYIEKKKIIFKPGKTIREILELDRYELNF